MCSGVANADKWTAASPGLPDVALPNYTFSGERRKCTAVNLFRTKLFQDALSGVCTKPRFAYNLDRLTNWRGDVNYTSNSGQLVASKFGLDCQKAVVEIQLLLGRII